MKTIIFLALCLILVSCNNANDCKTSTTKEIKEEATASCDSPDPDPVPVPDPSEEPIPEGEVPQEAFNFDASIKFTNFEVEQEQKVEKAVEIIKSVVASEEFRMKVLTYTYDGKRQFNNNNGLTNEQIYQLILEGSEKLIPGKDFEMDLELELYYTSNNTVGYTYPNTVKIWMNSKYFTPYTPAQVAGNMFHEWTHKLGFDHAANYTVARDSSVPYAIGYLIRDLGKKYE